MMADTKLYIPKTIKVGYQNRKDTYTGKLAYVIYTDDKGVLRKEKSWQSWRDHKIKPDDFDNEPTAGFVLNKGVGGARQSWSHWTRNEYVRVYDPRNFEFEISVANMLFILQETSSIKGKGLEGEFVYSWDGTELTLLPINSVEYTESVKHTERQKIRFDKNELKEGCSYIMKNGTEVLYLGRHSYNDYNRWRRPRFKLVGKRHIFLVLNAEAKNEWSDPILYLAETGFTNIAERTSTETLTQFPDEYDKFRKSKYCADVKDVKFKKVKFTDDMVGQLLFLKEEDNYYPVSITKSWGYNNNPASYNIKKSNSAFVPKLKNGNVELPETPSSGNGVKLTESGLSEKDLYAINVVTIGGGNIQI